MNILFIGNFQQGPGGEAADETHLAREMERMGHVVTKVNRDEWREYVIEFQPKGKYKVPEEGQFDIAIIAKWHHFYDGRFIEFIKTKYTCPVFYWVWDSMEGHTVGDWHMNMAQAADLYLSGELGRADFYRENHVRFYYFQFDNVDGDFDRYQYKDFEKKYDVIYPGSLNNQNGRIDLLKEINKVIKIHVFAHDWKEWEKEGFEASPAVYGNELNKVIAQSRIVLGTSCDPNCHGYWSNRVGKVLRAGGNLLQQYTPGMEQFIYPATFYSSAEEAVEIIRGTLSESGLGSSYFGVIDNSDWRWTSAFKVRQLTILIDRYLKTNGGEKWLLP